MLSEASRAYEAGRYGGYWPDENHPEFIRGREDLRRARRIQEETASPPPQFTGEQEGAFWKYAALAAAAWVAYKIDQFVRENADTIITVAEKGAAIGLGALAHQYIRAQISPKARKRLDWAAAALAATTIFTTIPTAAALAIPAALSGWLKPKLPPNWQSKFSGAALATAVIATSATVVPNVGESNRELSAFTADAAYQQEKRETEQRLAEKQARFEAEEAARKAAQERSWQEWRERTEALTNRGNELIPLLEKRFKEIAAKYFEPAMRSGEFCAGHCERSEQPLEFRTIALNGEFIKNINYTKGWSSALTMPTTVSLNLRLSLMRSEKELMDTVQPLDVSRLPKDDFNYTLRQQFYSYGSPARVRKLGPIDVTSAAEECTQASASPNKDFAPYDNRYLNTKVNGNSFSCRSWREGWAIVWTNHISVGGSLATLGR